MVAQDNARGGWTGDGVTSASTINYATGAVSVTFGTAPSSNDPLTMFYRFDIEQSPDELREMEIGLNLVPVQAKPHPLRVRHSVQSALAAQAVYSLDVQDTVSNLAAQFIRKEMDYRLIQQIRNAATAESDLNFDASVPNGITRKQHYSDFQITVSQADKVIFEKNNRGHCSFMIVGTNGSILVQSSPDFVPDPDVIPIGAHRVGVYRGRIDVVYDMGMPTNDIIFGFKGMQLGDAAIIVASWIPIYMTPVFQNSNLQNSQGLLSMYDILVNNSSYFTKGTVSNF